MDRFEGKLEIGQRIPSNCLLKGTYKIRVPKGTEFHTTHPQKEGVQVAKRTYTTGTVKTVSSECVDTVTWPGTGGYWCWAKKEDVEFAGEE